jgi:hypothetical protein
VRFCLCLCRLVWYVDPSVLTALSFLGLLITGTDFLFPLLWKTVSSSPEDWTPEREKKFSIFVNRIAYYSVQLWNTHVTLEEWKRDKPNIVSQGSSLTLTPISYK